MSLGTVRHRSPIVAITVIGAYGPQEIEVIVDTGFEGTLAFPLEIVQQLGLTPTGRQSLDLADGTTVHTFFYELVLEWEGEARTTEVLLLNGEPLLGMEILNGYFIQIEMIDGGEVALELL